MKTSSQDGRGAKKWPADRGQIEADLFRAEEKGDVAGSHQHYAQMVELRASGQGTYSTAAGRAGPPLPHATDGFEAWSFLL